MALLGQATFVAALLSAAIAIAYRGGGRRRLWIVGLGGLAALEVILLVGSMSHSDEGPLWITLLAVAPPVLLVTYVIELLGRRSLPLIAQIIVGTLVGILGYIAAAFVAYAGLLSLS
jgi:hypothetical protein